MEPRVAIVTGGGRGLGRAIALRLARDGFDLALAGPDLAELQASAAAVVELGRRTLTAVTDVAEEEQVHRLVREVLACWPHVDVLVNNAAVIGPTAPVAEVARA